MKILLAGGTGLIGRRLIELGTAEGYSFTVLTRARRSNTVDTDNITYSQWDPNSEKIDLKAFDGVDAVINLAGENIADGRWTAKRKNEIMQSRVLSTRLISNSIKKLEIKPSVFISASAIGYYRENLKGTIAEDGEAGSDFINEVCKAWEKEILTLSKEDIRLVQARIGIVISEKGGALRKMLLPFKLGLGGKLGSGKQYMSWISLDDTVRALLFCLQNEKIKGPVNLVSPAPVTNKNFTKILGAALGRPTIFSIPAFLLTTLLGEMADQLLLRSLPVVPDKLLTNRFEFKDKDLGELFFRLVK